MKTGSFTDEWTSPQISFGRGRWGCGTRVLLTPLLPSPLLPSPPTGVLCLGPVRGQQPGVLHDAGQDLSSELVGVAGGDAGPGVIEMRTWNSWQLELGAAQAAWAGVSSPLPPALTSSSPLSSCPVRNESRLQRSWCC